MHSDQRLTAYFTDRATAEDAAAELEAAGIDASEITVHDRHSGGGGFLAGIKRFFDGDSATADDGGTLLSTTADRTVAEPILRRYNGRLEANDATTTDSTARTYAGDDLDTERTMKLREERLTVDKRTVTAGEVRLGKEVVTQQQSIDVPVAHEEVFVSRRPVRDGAYGDDAGEIGDDAEIAVPVMREEVSVEKHAVVTDEVGLTKQTVQQTQTVDGTVRKERATIDGDIAGQVDDTRR